MKNEGYTFETIVGTNICTQVTLSYAKTILDLFDTRSKTERNHKRKVERLIASADDVIKLTSFLLKHEGIIELAKLEATSIETVLFLASDLDIEKREKVINYIHELNK